jgi:hypothetical protein
MEFTAGRRIRRRGRGYLLACAATAAADVGWFVLPRSAPGLSGPLALLGFVAVLGFLGVRELARARRPFRLVVDAFGVTAHDGVLSWAEIDTVALHHPSGTSDDGSPLHGPQLVLWPVPGAALPRKPDRTSDGRVRYTLVSTDDMDQGVYALTEALARHAGDRFETAPRSVRPPIPVTVAGPEHRVPGPERVFTAARGAGARFAVSLAAAVTFSVPCLFLLVAHHAVGPTELTAFWLVGAFAAWWWTGRSFRRMLRPLRLRVGATGIGARDVASAERFFDWKGIAAVTVGPRPDSTDRGPWLIVWPLPGAYAATRDVHLVDGHQAYSLVRLDRLPGGEEAVLDAVRAYAGERFTR